MVAVCLQKTMVKTALALIVLSAINSGVNGESLNSLRVSKSDIFERVSSPYSPLSAQSSAPLPVGFSKGFLRSVPTRGGAVSGSTPFLSIPRGGGFGFGSGDAASSSKSSARSASAVVPPPPKGGAATMRQQHAPLSVPAPIPTVSDDVYNAAILRTTLAIASAVMFGGALFHYRGMKTAQEFFAGYLVEQSLSVDNLFVFIMLFDYFRVPVHLQERVLNYGVLGAILMRGVMIGLGVAAIQKFKSVILLFAGILVASSIKLLAEGVDDGSGHGGSEDMSSNGIMKLTNWLFASSPKYDGEKFFTLDLATGKKLATPLFMCLICIELSDFVFAVDSIPAVLGVTKDPMVVYSR